jgi:type II secretory ATPase GspE/PulE/Tfp pilus assembly ATPase PilB-like protein
MVTTLMTHSASESALVAFAKRGGYPLIEIEADLPEDQEWVFESNSQLMLDNIADQKIIISKAGNIFTNTPSLQHIQRAKNALNNTLRVHENNMTVYVCRTSVMELIRQQHTKKMAERKGLIHSGRTEAQILMETIVNSALVEENVSDIHFFVNENTGKTYVQFRKDGILTFRRNSENKSNVWNSAEIMSACSSMINTDAVDEGSSRKTFNTNEAIDASFTLSVACGVVKIRYAQVPSSYGFKVALRLHRDGSADKEIKDIGSMGYLPVQCEKIDEATESAAGIVIISGPTGSGKTTMLNCVLRHIPDTKAIYTFEDPIEMNVPGATQVRVDNETPNSSLSWAALSKNALRLDPDVIMFGELRDQVVAREAVNMAMTGHLVLTTLHTNGALTCATRLNDLGISYDRMGDPNLLKAFIYQRLLPTTCPECSIALDDYKASGKNIKRLAQVNALFSKHQKVRISNTEKNNPCSVCTGGVNGRTLVAEVAEIDHAARKFMSENKIIEWETRLLENDWISINVHAAVHILQGRICPMRVNASLSEPITAQHIAIACRYLSGKTTNTGLV